MLLFDRKNSKILSDSESDDDIPKKIVKKSKTKAASNSDEDSIPKKLSKNKSSKSKKSSQSSSKVLNLFKFLMKKKRINFYLFFKKIEIKKCFSNESFKFKLQIKI